MVIPNSNIRIIKCPLELDNLNQITFASKAAQETYFKSLPYIEIDDASYQRKDGYIRFPSSFDTALPYNYVMYQNEEYSNKWFYAFITNKEYLNDEVTAIYIETDTFQTWQFDLVYKPSFIEREMLSTADDLVGANIIPEQLETGEYTNRSDIEEVDMSSAHAIACLTFDITETQPQSYPSQVMNGIPTGLHYFLIGDFTSVNGIGYITETLADQGKIDALACIIMAPDSLTGYNNINWDYFITGGLSYAPYKKLPDTSSSVLMNTLSFNKPYTDIDGYIPKNKKLFTYPYNFLMVDNNGGQANIYYYEDFSTTNVSFNVKGCITPGCSIKLFPLNYKNVSENNSESLTAVKYPIGSWNNNIYVNWLRQNALNVGVSIAGSVLSAVAGGATGNPIGVASGILGVANTVGQIYEHSLIPPSVEGNINSGDVNYSSGKHKFTCYKRNIKRQYAEIIDNFFSMYGYKTNRVKIPNTSNRSNWNYVKTINCNLEGEIPQKDLQSIKDMFNNGITLWHTTLGFLDYSQTNS